MRHGAAFLRPAAPLLDKALPSARVELLADGIHLHGGMESPGISVEVTGEPAHGHRHVERVFAPGQAEPCLLSSLELNHALLCGPCEVAVRGHGAGRALVDQSMDNNPAISELEDLSRDYTEKPRRILFVLGSGDGPAVEVFRRAAREHNTSIAQQHLAEMPAGTRRSVDLFTPMQMVPEIARELSASNVVIYQVRLLED